MPSGKPVLPARSVHVPAGAETNHALWCDDVWKWVFKYIGGTSCTRNALACDGYVLYIPTTDGYLSRNFKPDYEGPKWVQRGVAKLYVPIETQTLWHTSGPETLVVTEDIMSAIKVANCGFQAISVLGTTLHPHVAKWAKDLGYESAIVFFDDDSTIVREKTQKARNLLALVVSKVRTLGTGVDPKDMSDYDLIQDIQEVLL